MHPIIAKTFGGLSARYYFRNLFFGMLFPAVIIGMLNAGTRPIGFPVILIVMFTVNTLLYPYSRFVYESVVGFFAGDSIFVGNLVFVLFVKFMTMALCWSAALFVAPIGLLYLYLHHSRSA